MINVVRPFRPQMSRIAKAAVLLLATTVPAAAQDATSMGGLPPVPDPDIAATQAEVQFRVGESDLAEIPDLTSFAAEPASNIAAGYGVGCEDIHTYCYREIEMPAALLDLDGGEVRLLLQHELDPHDQLRVIDIHMGCEWTNDDFGNQDRYAGRYCWARQVGGGEYSFVLGDNVRHNVFTPWGWFWITDYAWLENEQPLGGNKIRLYAHPHVTGRVFFYN